MQIAAVTKKIESHSGSLCEYICGERKIVSERSAPLTFCYWQIPIFCGNQVERRWFLFFCKLRLSTVLSHFHTHTHCWWSLSFSSANRGKSSNFTYLIFFLLELQYIRGSQKLYTFNLLFPQLHPALSTNQHWNSRKKLKIRKIANGQISTTLKRQLY